MTGYDDVLIFHTVIEADMLWSYGVTTVPSRRHSLLPATLASLKQAGFDSPRLFVDGTKDVCGWSEEFGLEVTPRFPAVRTAGNWTLSLWELYLRQPDAERYAVFQDDFVTYKNLRSYLEKWYPGEGNDALKGYLNLYTFPSNQGICPTQRKPGHPGEGKPRIGWYKSNQFGRGAVALVFSREAVAVLLSAKHFVRRVMDAHRGWRAVDGGVVTAMGQEGWLEYVHNPSLVQHTGIESSMGNNPHLLSTSFRGEGYDALELLKGV